MITTQAMDNAEKTQKNEGIFVEPVLPKSLQSKIIKSEESDEAAEDQKLQKQPNLNDLRYQEPNWASNPSESAHEYFLEIIKEGIVIDTVRLHNDAHQKSFWSIGRFDPCDIKLEHPSISRFHAVLQYGECIRGRPGWYLFDLNSTHGVKLNKQPVKKRTYIPLYSGFVFQIAGSSRLFTVCGGPSNGEDGKGQTESTSLVGKRERDAEDEGESEEHHRFFEKDPIGWLQKYFEREGIPIHFQFTKSDGGGGAAGNLLAEFEDEQNKKKGHRRHSEDGHWTCTIELVSDISLTSGSVVTVSAPSKRLAQFQCALVACERLDDACLLRISSLWNKRKNYAENDFYDSDEDTFLDRTGQIEEQREKRRMRFGADASSSVGRAKNYTDLIKELAGVEAKLEVVRTEIQRLFQKDKILEDQQQQSGEEQQRIQPNFSRRMALSQLKGKEKKLLGELDKLQKLSEIAKPSHRLAPIVRNTPIESVKIESATSLAINEDGSGGSEICFKRQIVDSEEDEEVGMTGKGREAQAVVGTSAQYPAGERAYGETKGEDTFRFNSIPSFSETDVKVVAIAEGVPISASKTEERLYTAALPPPQHNAMADAIVPKFGMLTKEEMLRMKLLQKQMERKPELAAAVKRARLQQQELLSTDAVEEQQQTHDVREKYATWLPPEDQSGDGSTRLNKKFAGKY